jgi:hypothetical protein
MEEKLHVSAQKNMRWLGFFFDQWLLWNQHVDIMCNWAMSKVHCLKILGNLVSGMKLEQQCQIFNTIIIPVLTYRVPLWYKVPGKQQGKMIKKMQQVQNVGPKSMLGAFRTLQVKAMSHMAGVLPMNHRVERLMSQAAMRLRTLPEDTQTLIRMPDMWKKGGIGLGNRPVAAKQPVKARTAAGKRTATEPKTQLHRMATWAGVTRAEDEQVVPFTVAPWEPDLTPNMGCLLFNGLEGQGQQARAPRKTPVELGVPGKKSSGIGNLHGRIQTRSQGRKACTLGGLSLAHPCTWEGD